jgi:uncharacterized protein YjbJ (UPF0337 family)
MDRDRIEGTAKEYTGKVTGDEELETEGHAQDTWGEVKDTADDVKDTVTDKVEDVKERM